MPWSLCAPFVFWDGNRIEKVSRLRGVPKRFPGGLRVTWEVPGQGKLPVPCPRRQQSIFTQASWANAVALLCLPLSFAGQALPPGSRVQLTSPLSTAPWLQHLTPWVQTLLGSSGK